VSIPSYPRYTDSGVAFLGHVPSHWKITRLKRVARVFASNVDKKSTDGQTPVQLCNYTDVYYNDTISAGMRFMEATATEEQIARFTLRAGDTIITKDSETANDIAVAAYVPDDLPGVICGYHLSMVRPQDNVDGAFLKRYFDSAFAKATFEVRANGLTRVGLGQYALDNAAIALPPQCEQSQIAAFLDRETAKLDELVEEQRQLIELLKEKRQAVISHAVTKGLNPSAPMKGSGVNWLGEVPAHWQVSPIGKAAKLESGHTPSRSRPEYWEDCVHPWFGLADVWQIRDGTRDYVEVTKERVSDLGLANSSARMLPAGTVMLSRTASVGFSAISAVPMATTQDFANWICGENLLPEYLLFSLRSMRPEFDRLMMGSTHNTIYMPEIAKLTIAVPPLQEQHEIVEFVKDQRKTLDDLSSAATTAMSLLRERRSALISAAVTGKIDVRSLVERQDEAA
jgi:type I restriction enzyme S subunit